MDSVSIPLLLIRKYAAAATQLAFVLLAVVGATLLGPCCESLKQSLL